VTSTYPEAVREAVARGRRAAANRMGVDAAELAARRERFGVLLDRVLGELPIGVAVWLQTRIGPLCVSLGTRRCVAEFGGFPRQLFLDADVTADGCEPVQWRVWHLCMREDAAFAVADWESALAMAAEPVG
jgi:hypothetical protein